MKNINDPAKPGSLGELIRQLFTSAPFLQPLWQLILNISSFAHWIILFISLRAVIFSRISEFNEFGNNLNKTIKQKTDFKHFYYYQQIISEVNGQDITNQTKKIIILGEYNFLQIVPNFLKKECLIKHKNFPEKQQNFDLLKEKETIANDYRKTFESFTEKIERIIDFIDLTQNRLNSTNGNNYQQKKVDFIIFCLFQEYQSFAELERNEKIILSIE